MSTRMLLSFASFVTIILGACSTSNRTPPVSVSKAGPKSLPVIQTTHWVPTLAPGTSRYSVIDSSIISIGTDTSVKQLPLIATALYEMTLLPQDNLFTLRARVNSPFVDSSAETTTHTKSSQLFFSAHVSHYGQVTDILPGQSTTCSGGIDPNSSRVIDLVVPLPLIPISVGDAWSDSTTTMVCHGKVPLQEQIVRNYTLLADSLWNARAAVIIQRQTVIEVQTSSLDTTNHPSATGTGSAIAQLILKRQTGQLLESRSTSSLSLTLRTERGVFPITQKSQTYIRIQ